MWLAGRTGTILTGGETKGAERREIDGEGGKDREKKKKKEKRRKNHREWESKASEGERVRKREGAREKKARREKWMGKTALYCGELTLGLLHEHHLGVRQEVVAREEHSLAPCGRVTLQTLLLDQGQLLGRTLG